jgi:outer membrane cobalamin receptor
VFNPKFAALYHVTDKVTTWGSIGKGFRAPTLNELYRNFSVGALLTLGNANLGPESCLVVSSASAWLRPTMCRSARPGSTIV